MVTRYRWPAVLSTVLSTALVVVSLAPAHAEPATNRSGSSSLAAYVNNLYSAAAKEGAQNNSNHHGAQEWLRPYAFGLLGKRRLRAQVRAKDQQGRKEVTTTLIGANGTRQTTYSVSEQGQRRHAKRHTTYTFDNGTKLEVQLIEMNKGQRVEVFNINGRVVGAARGKALMRTFRGRSSRLLQRLHRAARPVRRR